MKRFVYVSVVIAILLSGCAASAGIPISTHTVVPSEIPTSALSPTATEAPTQTPVIPTATFVPLKAIPVSASPLTLTELNAGTEMKRLNVIGTGTAYDIKFSPDGKRLAIATGRGVYLYDGTTFEQTSFIDVNDSVSAIAFSPDGSTLVVAVDGKVSLWNVNSGQHMINLDGELVYVYKLAYGLGGYVAAIGGDCQGCGSAQDAMILWNARTGHQIFSQRGIWYATKALTFTSDGKQLFFGGKDGISAVETETGQVAEFNDGIWIHSSAVNEPGNFALYERDNKLYVTSYGGDGEIVSFDVKTRQAFNLCGTNLVSNNLYGVCSTGEGLIVFDLSTGEKIEFVDVGAALNDWSAMLALSPDSHYLAYGADEFVSIFNVQTKQLVRRLEFTDFDNVTTGIVLVEGVEKHVGAVKNPTGQISLFDLQSGMVLQTFSLECCEITSFAFAPDLKTAATLSGSTFDLWDIESNRILLELNLQAEYPDALAFSPDGLRVYFTDREDDVFEMDIQTKDVKNLGRNSYVYNYSNSFAADNYHFNSLGNYVAFKYEKSDNEQRPSFRDIITGEAVTLPYNAFVDPYYIESFAISNDDRYIVFGNVQGIYVWNSSTREQLYHFEQHEWRGGDGWIGAIKSLMFNPKSDLLISVGWDQTTRLWNIHTGNELRVLNVCCSASFTPDGRYLVTAGDGVMRVWGIP